MDRETAINNILRYTAFQWDILPADLKMKYCGKPNAPGIILAKEEAAYQLRVKLGFTWRFISEILALPDGVQARKFANRFALKNQTDDFKVKTL